MRHRVSEELDGILTLIAGIWAVFIADRLLPIELNQFGLQPRTLWGLPGIVTMPFLHADWQHILGNSIPLVVLLCLLAGSRANSYFVVPWIVLIGGVLLWIFGRSESLHVGASGLIYGLIAFLIVAGVLERRILAMALSVFVAFVYGATLLSGILPFTVGSNVSWDGHLAGAVSGGMVAYTMMGGRGR